MSATAFSLAVGSQGAAVALPAALAAADRSFVSSFEADDPAPDWLNTVDTAPDGGKRASGVDGGYSSGIPGNLNPPPRKRGGFLAQAAWRNSVPPGLAPSAPAGL
ncbi:hypothetical protein, partial [Streptomyces regalis]|uniref:hypothetical protein n=1 Tax=Streptomyces regalis TaxID=68262 RepID=UPI001FC98D6B